MTRRLAWAWIAVLAVVIIYFLMLYGSLPERIATHFDAVGKPNGFQVKGDFLASFLPFILLANGIIGALTFSMGSVPTRFINIPRRDYWLATEERKKELFGKLRATTCLLGLFLNATFLFTLHVIYQANTPNPWLRLPFPGGLAVILACLVSVVIFAIIILRPPSVEKLPKT